MMVELMKRIIAGIAAGGIFTFIVLTILMINEIDITAAEVWVNMLGSFIMGIYFGVNSLIFDIEKWSPLKQTTVHFSLSLLFYFVIALPLGWVPFTLPAVLIAIVLFTFIYMLYWSGFRLYFKKMESKMNDIVGEKK